MQPTVIKITTATPTTSTPTATDPPTPQPTPGPTPMPSPNPTAIPTPNPTPSPTRKPTPEPKSDKLQKKFRVKINKRMSGFLKKETVEDTECLFAASFKRTVVECWQVTLVKYTLVKPVERRRLLNLDNGAYWDCEFDVDVKGD